MKYISNELVRKTILKYRDKSKYDFNCAEAIIATFNELYNLDLKTRHFAAFGGGMGIGSTCGAICASIGIIGTLFVKKVAHEKNCLVKEISKKFFSKLSKKIETTECKILRRKINCTELVIIVGKTLNDIINKYSNKLNF